MTCTDLQSSGSGLSGCIQPSYEESEEEAIKEGKSVKGRLSKSAARGKVQRLPGLQSPLGPDQQGLNRGSLSRFVDLVTDVLKTSSIGRQARLAPATVRSPELILARPPLQHSACAGPLDRTTVLAHAGGAGR